jgi:hypothetical protein
MTPVVLTPEEAAMTALALLIVALLAVWAWYASDDA